MWKRKRIKILLIVGGKYKFLGTCSATVSINSNEELLENYCKEIEDLEDVEFVEIIGKEDGCEEIPSELQITDSDIEEIINVYC